MIFQFKGAVKPKARPRTMPCACGRKPRIVSDPLYRAWKDVESVVQGLSAKKQLREMGELEPLMQTSYLSMKIMLDKDGATVDVRPIPGHEHNGRKKVKGDIDNLAGAIADALEDAGVYKNDRQIAHLEVTIT